MFENMDKYMKMSKNCEKSFKNIKTIKNVKKP